MANFTTHCASGVLVGGALSTLTIAASLATPGELMTLVFAGALGAVLPDIDLENSRASQALFSGLGVFFAFAALFNIGIQYSIAEMILLWLGIYVGVRYIGHNLFHKIAVHRGIFHSILAAAFFGMMTAVIYWKLFQTTPTIAWLAGVFLFIGYIVHLVLDEAYSVDVLDTRVKSSFGTALKLFDRQNVIASLLMAIAVGGTFFITPPANSFIEVFGTREVWVALNDRLLPNGKWFGAFGAQLSNIADTGKADAPLDATGSTSKITP